MSSQKGIMLMPLYTEIQIIIFGCNLDIRIQLLIYSSGMMPHHVRKSHNNLEGYYVYRVGQ